MTRNSQVRRQLRHVRLRKKVAGTASVPRFCVSLTANNMYCQFIDDDAGVTLASSSTAEKAIAAGVSKVVFDRSGFQYHGRIKALADAARKAGLQF